MLPYLYSYFHFIYYTNYNFLLLFYISKMKSFSFIFLWFNLNYCYWRLYYDNILYLYYTLDFSIILYKSLIFLQCKFHENVFWDNYFKLKLLQQLEYYKFSYIPNAIFASLYIVVRAINSGVNPNFSILFSSWPKGIPNYPNAFLFTLSNIHKVNRI